MAVKTQALTPFNPTSIPDRLTPLYVCDKTVVATTAGTGAVKRLNRVQGASFKSSVPVMDISEMGAQARIGGVDDLGEVTVKIDFNQVGIDNLAAVVGKTVDQTSGHTTSIGPADWQSTSMDIFRLAADTQNTIFGTLYMQDCIVDDYQLDVKVSGVATDSIQGRSPNGTFFPGFVLPKVYAVQAGDITAGVCTINLAGVLGADEAPVEIYLPAAGNAPSYWQLNGAQFFLKIEQLPGGSLTAAPKRYYETGAPAAETATYNNSTKALTFPNGAVAAGDVFRLVLLSYNTNSFPLTVPASSPATSRAAVAARSVPIEIGTNQIKRIQSTSIKFTFKREHVNGVGEPTIIYGPPSIPDVSITFDLKEYDDRVLSALSTGSPYMSDAGGNIQNDFQDLTYITRQQLATPYPFNVKINDPFNVSQTLLTATTPQIVVKDIEFGSTNKSDNTIKITAEDITGTLTLSYTHP